MLPDSTPNRDSTPKGALLLPTLSWASHPSHQALLPHPGQLAIQPEDRPELPSGIHTLLPLEFFITLSFS